MPKTEFLTATIAEDALCVSRRFGFGIELDEFCTASNMDGEDFPKRLEAAEKITAASAQRAFHAPFSEIFPSAVDSLMRGMGLRRLNQAFELAYRLGYRRIVLHSGYMPRVYFKEWFLERSVEFWLEFLADKPKDASFALENVLDDEPYTLRDIADKVNDSRFGLCFDMGHANIVTSVPIGEWVEVFAPRLFHVHAHNNFGEHDTHSALFSGSIDAAALLRRIKKAAPGAVITLEMIKAESSALWLFDNGLLEE